MKYTKKVPYFKKGDKIDKAARNLPKKQREAVLKVSSVQKEQEGKDKLSSVGANFKKPTARVEGPKTSQASKIKQVEKKPVKPAAKTRGEAFQQARARGDSEFLWQGKRYHTRTAEEEAKRKASAGKTSKDKTNEGKTSASTPKTTENKQTQKGKQVPDSSKIFNPSNVITGNTQRDVGQSGNMFSTIQNQNQTIPVEQTAPIEQSFYPTASERVARAFNLPQDPKEEVEDFSQSSKPFQRSELPKVVQNLDRAGTQILHGVQTLGGSVVGNAINLINPEWEKHADTKMWGMFPVTSEEKFASHSSNNPDRWDNIWKDSGKALLTGGAAIAAGEGIGAVARNSGPLMGRVVNTVRERVPVTRYAPFMSDASFSGGSQILRDKAGNIVSRAFAYPGNIVGSQGAARVAGGTATQRAVGTGLNRAGQSQLQVGVNRAGQKLVDQGVVAPTRLGLPMPPGPHQLSFGFKRGGTINKFQRGNVLTNREQHLVDVSRLPKLSVPQVWGRKLFGTGPKPVETGRTHLNKAGEQVPEVGNRVIMPGGRDNTTITRGTNYGSGWLTSQRNIQRGDTTYITPGGNAPSAADLPRYKSVFDNADRAIWKSRGYQQGGEIQQQGVDKEALVADFVVRYLKTMGVPEEAIVTPEGSVNPEYEKELTAVIKEIDSPEFWLAYQSSPDEVVTQVVRERNPNAVTMARKGTKLKRLSQLRIYKK